MLRSMLFETEVPGDPRSYFSRLPVLETERLRLRPLRMRDAADIFEYGRDPAVSEHCLWEPYRSMADARAYLRFIRRQYRMALPSSYGIELKATGHIIGTIGFMSWQEADASAEVGYSLAQPYWHRGYATEALRAVLDLAFDRMKLHRVEAQHEVTNPASGRVMLKCGMRREGILRGRVMNRGHYSDVALYAILAEDRVKQP